MATATYYQEGDSIPYTPSSDVAAGQIVVQNALIGVARDAISANTLGSLRVKGVLYFPKATGTSSAIAAGVDLYFDVADGVVKADSESGVNPYAGKSVLAATDADATVLVRMSQ